MILDDDDSIVVNEEGPKATFPDFAPTTRAIRNYTYEDILYPKQTEEPSE